MDLFWRENLVCPTEPEYIEMVNNSLLLSSHRSDGYETDRISLSRDRRTLQDRDQAYDGCFSGTAEVRLPAHFSSLHRLIHLAPQRLCTTRKSHWDHLPNSRRLRQLAECRGESGGGVNLFNFKVKLGR